MIAFYIFLGVVLGVLVAVAAYFIIRGITRRKIFDSLRKHEHMRAPGHACLTYSAKGHDVIHSASAFSVKRTMQRPGGTN